MPHLLLVALASASPAAEPHVPEDGSVDRPVHLRLDTTAMWGIGGQMYLGAQVHGLAQKAVWARPGATGTVDGGVQLHYGNEATFLAPWIDTTTTKGATQRVQLVATLGHTFHLGTRRRWTLGLRGYAGWNHWRSSYAIDFDEVGVQGSDTVTDDRFVAGGQLDVGVRLTRVVGLQMVMGAPFPVASSYAVTLANLGVGLTWHLR